jgi:ATP-dependent Lhr-like helicase
MSGSFKGQRRGAARLPRALREQWRGGAPVQGNWFSLAAEEEIGGIDQSEGAAPESSPLLMEEERNKERVRILLNRWGVLARPLLQQEAPCFSWSRLLPAMRRMELAGELVAGRFFSGVNSLQFGAPNIAAELEAAEAEAGIYWLNAQDPASPAGLEIEGALPEGISCRRLATTRLCFRGAELAAKSERGGKQLEVFVSPDDPDIAEVLAFAKFPVTRNINPEKKVVVESINGKTAALSEYASILATSGFIKDRGKLVLYKPVAG